MGNTRVSDEYAVVGKRVRVIMGGEDGEEDEVFMGVVTKYDESDGKAIAFFNSTDSPSGKKIQTAIDEALAANPS